MPWTRKLAKPIRLRDGRELVTLADARALILGLTERAQARPFWVYTAELLLEAAESDYDLTQVSLQLWRALMRDGML